MLTKEKSKQVFKLKYVLLLPIIIGMLFYTSCVNEEEEVFNLIKESITVSDIENLTEKEEVSAFNRLIELSVQSKEWALILKDENSTITFSKAPKNSSISGPGGIPIKAKMHIESSILDENFNFFEHFSKEIQIKFDDNSVPFQVVDEVPVFPGCENEADQKACFNRMIQKHISKNFRYPQKAQELGIQGRVSTMFIIANDGSIQNIKMRGPDSLLENEVYRIISRLPKMTPGKMNGEAVNVPFSIPISFKLQDGGLKKLELSKVVNPDPIYFIDGKESTKKEFNSLDRNKSIEHITGLRKEYAIKKYGKRGENGIVEALTKEFFNSNPELGAIHSQLTKLIKERSRLLKNAVGDNPIVRDLDAQIDALQREQDKLVKKQLK